MVDGLAGPPLEHSTFGGQPNSQQRSWFRLSGTTGICFHESVEEQSPRSFSRWNGVATESLLWYMLSQSSWEKRRFIDTTWKPDLIFCFYKSAIALVYKAPRHHICTLHGSRNMRCTSPDRRQPFCLYHLSESTV